MRLSLPCWGRSPAWAVYLLGFSLPYGRNFTRDYICKKLELSDKLGQEILDELCSYGMLNRISIQISDECVDAYAVQSHSCDHSGSLLLLGN